MPKAEPFEAHAERYDEWFEAHEYAYRSERSAVRELLPTERPALEVGVGSGRFAGPLGVGYGVDPAGAMLARARERGIEAVRGVAEALPVRDDAVAAALNVTTICFVDDVVRTLAESRRVLKPGGRLVVGMVDRDSPLGRRYRERRDENPFYREATFLSSDELDEAMQDAGFGDLQHVQTVFTSPGEMTEPDPVREGTGEGSFVVVAGTA